MDIIIAWYHSGFEIYLFDHQKITLSKKNKQSDKKAKRSVEIFPPSFNFYF